MCSSRGSRSHLAGGLRRARIDQAGRVDPGRLPDSAQVVGDEDTVTFVIPGGRVSVSVETDERTLSDDVATDPPPGLEPDKLPDPKVWVRSGGQSERLTGTSEGVSRNAEGGAFAFATRDPLVVEVEFAGRRQPIDVTNGPRTAGVLAALYRPRPTPTGQDLVRGHRTGDLWWSSTLTVRYDRVRYLHDLGWAKKGREWLVLGEAEHSVDDFADPDVRKNGTTRWPIRSRPGRSGWIKDAWCASSMRPPEEAPPW